MRTRLSFVAVLLAATTALAACGGGSSSPETDLARVKEAGVLKIGTEGTYSPFSYHDPTNNQLTGYDVEVAKAVAAKLGVKAEFVETPWDAIFAGLTSKRFDVIAMDLETGAELWPRNIQFNTGDWTTWVAGVSQGRLYASRSGNGASVFAKLHCFDSTTGAPLWMSVESTNAGAYDGVVFAPNGDPVIGTFTKIWRIDHLNGSTVWSVPRTASISGDCGVAVNGNAVYSTNFTASGLVIARYDLATGAFQYQSGPMPGSTQNTPMVGPDGTI